MPNKEPSLVGATIFYTDDFGMGIRAGVIISKHMATIKRENVPMLLIRVERKNSDTLYTVIYEDNIVSEAVYAKYCRKITIEEEIARLQEKLRTL